MFGKAIGSNSSLVEQIAGYVSSDATLQLVPIGCASATAPKLLVPGKRPTVVFLGSLSRHFDFESLHGAWSLLKQRSSFADARLVIAGSGDLGPAVEALFRADSSVEIVGRLDSASVETLLRSSMLAVAPYVDGSRLSLTNKIFEFTSAGIPFIHTLEGETRIFGERHGIGRYSRCSGVDLGMAMAEMLGSAETLTAMSEAQYQFASTQASVTTSAEKIADLLAK